MYILFAILVIGFLIFIHELGHYYMARKVGMKVEAFGIGFGRPIRTFVRDGVEWRLNWLPFGGYVKIKGTETDSDTDPYEVPDGFFGKSPWDRIKVSLAGPLANLLFALLVFAFLWLIGGRTKTYSELTSRVGWVDPQSQLYEERVRPGDEILSYNGHAVASARDHVFAPMTAGEQLKVQGEHIDYFTGEKTPFDVYLHAYPHPYALDKDLLTAGIIDSASYLIYHPDIALEDELVGLLAQGSPLQESGIQDRDRLVWANGEVIFSQTQLSHLINDEKALLTIERGGKAILRRVPRVFVYELRMHPDFREEVIDWQYAADLGNWRIASLRVIPYNITMDNVVEEEISYIDPEDQKKAFAATRHAEFDEPLQRGDRIVAVNGNPVQYAYELLESIQQPAAVMIVLRKEGKEGKALSWREADQEFSQEIDWNALQSLVGQIGKEEAAASLGSLHRLKVVVPKKHIDFATTSRAEGLYLTKIKENRQELESIEDPEKRNHLDQLLEEREERLYLGPPYFDDHKVIYNPGPIALFGNVLSEIWRTLVALVSGALSPKWITGPVGLVQVVQQNWAAGITEGLFWLGTISLNLGILNLLPIPVLDGGSICFSLFELITRRRIKTKTLEKLIIPFAVLLILFFVFLTYNDVSRIFKQLLG